MAEKRKRADFGAAQGKKSRPYTGTEEKRTDLRTRHYTRTVGRRQEKLDIGGNWEDNICNRPNPNRDNLERKIMQFKKVAIVVCAVVCAALMLNVAAKAADPHSGTWKMNAAKSTYSPGPAPKSITLKIETDGKSYKVHSESIDAAGKPTTLEFNAMLDGKDYPGTGLQAGADMVSVETVDANTVRATMKKGGKAVLTVTSVVSADGKTRTSTFVGKDAEGHDVKNVVVYDKQ